MSNININTGANISRSIPQSSPQSATPGSNSVAPAKSDSGMPSYQNTSTSASLNLLTERMFSTVNTLNALNARELTLLIRQLLAMPNDLRLLLAMLAFGNTDSSQLANLLKNLKAEILLKDIQQLLNTNSKEVINKLIQLTQNNALFFEGSNQLRDILGIIQKISISSQISHSDALTNIMLLYLPWLPLMQQQQLELFFGYQESEEGSEDFEVLVMFIKTANIGVFKVTIILNPDKSIEIDIENDSVATNVIEKIVKETKNELNENGITSKISTITRKTPESKTPKELKSDSQKSISIHPSGKISVITVNTAYKIAKTIFAIDEKQTLIKNREEKIK